MKKTWGVIDRNLWVLALLGALIWALALFFPFSRAFAAGSWTEAEWLSPAISKKVMIITYTADAADASIPTYTFSATDKETCKGYYLYNVEVDPGTTAPTNGHSMYIKDEFGLDYLGDQGNGTMSNSTTQWFIPKPGGTAFQYPYMYAGKTRTGPAISLTGNAVNSATATFVLFFSTKDD